MSNSELFLVSFSVLGIITAFIVYNIDFSQWENKHTHE